MKLVGRYQVMSRIGEGAMADVYRAYDPEIQRELAIKILNQRYRRDPECVERFLREARAAGSLSHPNIVTIYDVGEVQGYPYIAMELLDGKPLDKVMEARGAIPASDVLHIGSQLADALRYAHDFGIVHRDIKPSNIILSTDGKTAKILDFGIARVAEATEANATAAVMTQVGQVLGTPRYMSPEQALGHPLDGRSDLFSLGVVMYELIAGKPAFSGSSALTLALQITTQDHEPISVTPECPRGLRFIIDKLLAKRPEKRFADGKQLIEALSRESAACNARASEERARHLPLHLRFAFLAAAIVATVLGFGTTAVLDRQYRAMERVAVTSGSSIATFVASNAALTVVENAARPSGQADWLPVQAFVKTASADRNITQMMVVDQTGVVRAASDPSLIGLRYQTPLNQELIDADIALSSGRDGNGVDSFRFTRPIVYAGRTVGRVDLSIRKDELNAAANEGRGLLMALGGLMLAMTLGLAFFAGKLVLAPLRRLTAAFKDAANGNLDFRISHRRTDEFGDLFDTFNHFAASIQSRIETDAPASVEQPSLLVAAAPAPDAPAHVPELTVLRARA